jgi:hypothetical protein
MANMQFNLLNHLFLNNKMLQTSTRIKGIDCSLAKEKTWGWSVTAPSFSGCAGERSPVAERSAS